MNLFLLHGPAELCWWIICKLLLLLLFFEFATPFGTTTLNSIKYIQHSMYILIDSSSSSSPLHYRHYALLYGLLIPIRQHRHHSLGLLMQPNSSSSSAIHSFGNNCKSQRQKLCKAQEPSWLPVPRPLSSSEPHPWFSLESEQQQERQRAYNFLHLRQSARCNCILLPGQPTTHPSPSLHAIPAEWVEVRVVKQEEDRDSAECYK